MQKKDDQSDDSDEDEDDDDEDEDEEEEDDDGSDPAMKNSIKSALGEAAVDSEAEVLCAGNIFCFIMNQNGFCLACIADARL